MPSNDAPSSLAASLNQMMNIQAMKIKDLEQKNAKLITEVEFLKAKLSHLTEKSVDNFDREEDAFND